MVGHHVDIAERGGRTRQVYRDRDDSR